MPRQRLVIGNWKMHGSLASIDTLLQALKSIPPVTHYQIAVLPPFVYLNHVQDSLQNMHIAWGAQNLSAYTEGAYTGEVSANMLKDFGCSYVLVGHSERRQLFGEDNQTVGRKFIQAIQAGLRPILCVGETQSQRAQELTAQIVLEQLESVLNLAPDLNGLSQAIIAYEPVWAIGTGLTATPEQAQEVHLLLRQALAKRSEMLATTLPILYGGSVKPNNARSLFMMPDIDGALVGGASLVADEFKAICQAME